MVFFGSAGQWVQPQIRLGAQVLWVTQLRQSSRTRATDQPPQEDVWFAGGLGLAFGAGTRVAPAAAALLPGP